MVLQGGSEISVSLNHRRDACENEPDRRRSLSGLQSKKRFVFGSPDVLCGPLFDLNTLWPCQPLFCEMKYEGQIRGSNLRLTFNKIQQESNVDLTPNFDPQFFLIFLIQCLS
jgi:hypothetical protein